MFFRPPFFLPWLYPNLVWRIPTDKKEIFLTFDDGPVPGPTEFVLEALRNANAKATFFCIGDNVRKHPSIFKKVMDGGHAYGNHTFNHLKGWNYSVDDYLANIDLCRTEFAKHGKQTERELFRPPYGRIRRAQARALASCEIVMWDVLTRDYEKTLSPAKCLAGSIGATRPGSIIVFHDSLKAEKNLTHVLPRYLDHFQNEGYSFNVIPLR